MAQDMPECWKAQSFSELSACKLFEICPPNPGKVAKLITSDREEYMLTQHEARIFIWLKDYVKNSSGSNLTLFLHFTTGSQNMPSKPPKVSFN